MVDLVEDAFDSLQEENGIASNPGAVGKLRHLLDAARVHTQEPSPTPAAAAPPPPPAAAAAAAAAAAPPPPRAVAPLSSSTLPRAPTTSGSLTNQRQRTRGRLADLRRRRREEEEREATERRVAQELSAAVPARLRNLSAENTTKRGRDNKKGRKQADATLSNQKVSPSAERGGASEEPLPSSSSSSQTSAKTPLTSATPLSALPQASVLPQSPPRPSTSAGVGGGPSPSVSGSPLKSRRSVLKEHPPRRREEHQPSATVLAEESLRRVGQVIVGTDPSVLVDKIAAPLAANNIVVGEGSMPVLDDITNQKDILDSLCDLLESSSGGTQDGLITLHTPHQQNSQGQQTLTVATECPPPASNGQVGFDFEQFDDGDFDLGPGGMLDQVGEDAQSGADVEAATSATMDGSENLVAVATEEASLTPKSSTLAESPSLSALSAPAPLPGPNCIPTQAAASFPTSAVKTDSAQIEVECSRNQEVPSKSDSVPESLLPPPPPPPLLGSNSLSSDQPSSKQEGQVQGPPPVTERPSEGSSNVVQPPVDDLSASSEQTPPPATPSSSQQTSIPDAVPAVPNSPERKFNGQDASQPSKSPPKSQTPASKEKKDTVLPQDSASSDDLPKTSAEASSPPKPVASSPGRKVSASVKSKKKVCPTASKKRKRSGEGTEHEFAVPSSSSSLASSSSSSSAAGSVLYKKKRLPDPKASPRRTRSKTKKEEDMLEERKKKAMGAYKVSMAAMIYREVNCCGELVRRTPVGGRSKAAKAGCGEKKSRSRACAKVARKKLEELREQQGQQQLVLQEVFPHGDNIYTVHFVGDGGELVEASTSVVQAAVPPPPGVEGGGITQPAKEIQQASASQGKSPAADEEAGGVLGFPVESIVIQDSEGVLDPAELTSLKRELESALANSSTDNVLSAFRDANIVLEGGGGGVVEMAAVEDDGQVPTGKPRTTPASSSAPTATEEDPTATNAARKDPPSPRKSPLTTPPPKSNSPGREEVEDKTKKANRVRLLVTPVKGRSKGTISPQSGETEFSAEAGYGGGVSPPSPVASSTAKKPPRKKKSPPQHKQQPEEENDRDATFKTPVKRHLICAITPVKPSSPAPAVHPGFSPFRQHLHSPSSGRPSRADSPAARHQLMLKTPTQAVRERQRRATGEAFSLATPKLGEEGEATGGALHTPPKAIRQAFGSGGTPYYTPSMTTAASSEHTPGLEFMRQEVERLSASDFSEDSMSPTRFRATKMGQQGEEGGGGAQKVLASKRRRNAAAGTKRDARKNIGLAIEESLSRKFPNEVPASTSRPEEKTPSPKKGSSSPPAKRGRLQEERVPKTPSPNCKRDVGKTPSKKGVSPSSPPEGEVPVTPGKSLASSPVRQLATPDKKILHRTPPKGTPTFPAVLGSPAKIATESGLPPTPGKLIASKLAAAAASGIFSPRRLGGASGGSGSPAKAVISITPKKSVPPLAPLFSPLRSASPSPNRLVIFSPGKTSSSAASSRPPSAQKDGGTAKVLRQRSSNATSAAAAALAAATTAAAARADKKQKRRAVLIPVPRTSPLKNSFKSNWEARHDAHNYDQIRTDHNLVGGEGEGDDVGRTDGGHNADGGGGGRKRRRKSRHHSAEGGGGETGAGKSDKKKGAVGGRGMPRTRSFPTPRKRKRVDEAAASTFSSLDVNLELVPQLGKLASSSSGESAKDDAAAASRAAKQHAPATPGRKGRGDLPSALGLVRRGKEAKSTPRKRGAGCANVRLSDCSEEVFEDFLHCDLDGDVLPRIDFVVLPPSSPKSRQQRRRRGAKSSPKKTPKKRK